MLNSGGTVFCSREVKSKVSYNVAKESTGFDKNSWLFWRVNAYGEDFCSVWVIRENQSVKMPARGGKYLNMESNDYIGLITLLSVWHHLM